MLRSNIHAIIKRIPFYPVLFSIFPALSFAAIELSEINPRIALRPILTSMLSCVAIYIFTWLLKTNWYKSAIGTLFCLFLFYSFGHVFQFLENNPIGNLSLRRYRNVIIIYSLVVITGIVGLVPNNPDALPDLYLIILDTYCRGDALLNDFHFDNSQIPPIIILMGDYGLRNANRLKILNAYYLPGDNSNIRYPGISPVNSFRLIFDTYFGTNYGFLADESWLGEEGALIPETSPDCLP